MASAAYLAYESADQEAAFEVAAELERNGWAVTRSGPQLRAPERLPVLVQTVADAGVVIVLASPAAEASAALRADAAAALNNGRPIIVLQTADLSEASWIRDTLDTSQMIDLRGGAHSEALARLVDLARQAGGRGRVIAMASIKGGVGKTVLAANLFAAAHLADNRSVSFIDLDPQHNLTQYFLSSKERSRLRDRTLHAVLNPRGGVGGEDFASLAAPLNRAKHAAAANFELIPGDERLFAFTLDAKSEADKAAAFTRFRALVAHLRAKADVVVIDSSPCATFLTRMAVASADHIVAPARPEKYSLAGLNMLEHVVREIRGRPLRPSEFSVLLNGVGDRNRSDETGDANALTRDEISNAPFFSTALLAEEVPHTAMLRSPPSELFAANPINITAMMRVGGRPAKEALTHAVAAILRRAAP